MPSTTVSATVAGVITYVQSATPTGVNDLTYGICKTGTATYSAASPNCATGVIHYSPGVTSRMGDDVTVVGVTSHQYQGIDSAVTAPATVAANGTFKVRIAPS